MVRLKSLKRTLGTTAVIEDPSLIKDFVNKLCPLTNLNTNFLPKAIVRPTQAQHIEKIIRDANIEREKILIVGKGTKPYCFDLKYVSLIVDTSSMDNLISINTLQGYAAVSAGIGILDLDSLLRKLNLRLKVNFPTNSTIGSLVTSRIVSSKSFKFGNFIDQVEELSFIDGIGRRHVFKSKSKAEQLERTEGTIGVIDKVLLKLDKNSYSYVVKTFSSFEEALEKSQEFENQRSVFGLTILHPTLTKLLGLENEGFSLIIAKHSLDASQKDEFLDRKEQFLHEKLSHLGLTHFEDIQFSSFATLKEFTSYLSAQDILYYVYPSSLVVRTYLPLEKNKLMEVLDEAHKLNADVGLLGFGSLKRRYVPLSLKRRILKLKEDYDYNNTLNPGKIIALK